MNKKTQEVNDVMVVWEFRGDYPDIPTFPDVDIAGLTAGDENPVYITLPIGQPDSQSRNKRFYDQAFVVELARQTQERKPVGYMGHVKGGEMEWPEDDVHWVGAQMVDGQLWGKAYVSSEGARKRARLYKSTNKPIATSIYAHMSTEWDGKLGAYRAKADTLDLHRIDLGPIDMAGIQSLAKVPHLTAEFLNDEDIEDKEHQMDKLQLIREMTEADASLLPANVREAVLASVQEPPEVKLVQELREELGDGDLLTVVREFKQKEAERQETAVTERIAELVNDPETGIKVESARKVVMELVKAKQPKTAEEAETAYKDVSGSELVTEMLKAQVAQAGGPPLRTGIQGNSGEAKYFAIPKE